MTINLTTDSGLADQNERSVAAITSPADHASISAALDRATQGRATRLAICGARGTGRTTLVEAARVDAATRSMTVLATHGRPADIDIKFAPLMTFLQPVVDRLPELPESEEQALAAVVELRADDVNHRAAKTGLWRLLTTLSQESPLLVAVDDSEHMDASSLDLLAFAVGRLDAQPVAVVAAGDCHRAPNALMAASDEMLVLDALDRESLLRSVQTNAPATDWVVAHMASFAGNSAAIATELVRSLDVDQRAGRAACPQVPVPPDSFVTALAPDLAMLSEPAKYALALIAADSTGDLDVLRAAHLAAQQDEAAWAELEAGGHLATSGTTVRLQQPLFEVVAYDQLAPNERRALHLRLASVMTSPRYQSHRAWQLAAGADGPDAMVADEVAAVARDHEKSGLFRSSAVAWERAAGLSIDRHDQRRRMIRALGLWTAIGDAVAVRGVLRRPHDASVASYLARSAAVRWLDGDAAAVVELRAAAAKAELEERPLIEALYADAALGAGRAQEAAELAIGIVRGAVPGPSLHLAEAILVLAGRATPQHLTPLTDVCDETAVVHTRAVLRHAQAQARYGNMAAAELALERLGGNSGSAVWDPAERSAIAARIHTARGEPQVALRTLFAQLEQLSNTAHIAKAVLRDAIAECEFLIGEPEQAMATLDEIAPVFEAAGMARHEASARSTVGRVAWSVGHTDVAASCFERARGLDPSAPIGDLVALLISLDREEDARAWLTRIDVRPDEPIAPMDVLRARAAIDGSTSAYERAIAAARGSDLVVSTIELLIDQVATHHRRQQLGDVRVAGAEAAQLMIPSGIRAWVDRLEQFKPAAPSSVVPAVLEELTGAERRVALAVSKGLTNKEAAAELFVSVKTIDSHLQRIYPKLFIRSRAELAALVNASAA